jgi:hypothetical protein
MAGRFRSRAQGSQFPLHHADKRPHQQSGNRYCRKGKECPGDSYGKPIGIKRCKTKCRDGGLNRPDFPGDPIT